MPLDPWGDSDEPKRITSSSSSRVTVHVKCMLRLSRVIYYQVTINQVNVFKITNRGQSTFPRKARSTFVIWLVYMTGARVRVDMKVYNYHKLEWLRFKPSKSYKWNQDGSWAHTLLLDKAHKGNNESRGVSITRPA